MYIISIIDLAAGVAVSFAAWQSYFLVSES
jgi:hypothetical protein